MADNDVLIKVAADVAQAVQALQQMVGQIGEVVKAVSDTKTVTAEGEKTTKSFWETWLTGVNQTGASAVAWGAQMSKAFDALKSGLAGAVGAMPRLVLQSAEAGDRLQTLANQLDTTVGRLGELQYIGDQTGVSMEELARSSQLLAVTLNDASSSGAKAIERLGLNIQELASKDKTEAMFTIIQRIKDVVPAAQQSATMLEIFGNRARSMTVLLKEDLAGLRESYRQLGSSAEDLAKLAREGDRFKDALSNIRTVQEAWRTSLANAVLPAINDLLERLPGLGGAVLTLGEGFLTTAAQIGPLLGNIALLKSSGLAATLASWAASIPGVTSALTAARVAVGGLTAALGPLAVALGGVTLAWTAWKQASQESGWVRELSDAFEYAGLRVMGYSAAEADAMIATRHATERSLAAAQAQRELGAASQAAAVQLESGMDRLAAKTREVNAAYQALTAAQKTQIKAALDAGLSTKEIAELLATDLKVSTEVAQQAIEKFRTALQQAKKEAEKSPFQKLVEEAKQFGKTVSEAAAQGLPLNQMLDQFGKQAADMVMKAAGMKNGLAQVPPEVAKLAETWRTAQLNEKLKTLTDQAAELAKTFGEKVASGAQAAQQAVTKMSQEMTLAMLSGSQKRLQQIAFEEEAAREALAKQTAALDKALAEQEAKIRKHFEERRKTEEQFAAPGAGVSPARLAQMAAEEEAALAAARSQVEATRQAYAEQAAIVEAYYAQQRALEAKATGDFEKDAELRGLKTKRVYEEELAKQRETLAFMKANREQFTAADIKKQEEVVQAAEMAAGKVRLDWQGALEALTRAFEQMATIAGASFGGIVKAVGEAVGAVNVMAKGLSSAFGKAGVGGIGEAFKAASQGAGGLLGVMKGVASVLPGIGSAVGGIMAAAGAAVNLGKKLWDAVTKSGGEKMAKDVGRDFGVQISEEMGDAFFKTAKEKFRGDRFAASVYHLTDIIKQAGGITEQNVTKMLGRLRDVFVMVETGKFSVQDATKVLDENFGAFADHVLKSGQVASRQFTELLQLNARFGTQSKAIMEFVSGQTGRLGTALARLAGGQDQTNESMARFERLAVAGFNAAVAAGVPFLEAVNRMGPALDRIVEGNKRLGREGGEAIAELLRFREVATAHRDLVDAAGALNEVMLALSTTGSLNAATLADLEAQGAETFDKLIAAGFTEQQALQQMKAFLEQVRTAHTELGLPIDENTKKLLDQATAQGVLKGETLSATDIMLEGFGAIIEALGGKLPEAFKRMKQSAADSAGGVRNSFEQTVTPAIERTTAKLAEPVWAEYAVAAQVAATTVAGNLSAVAATVKTVQATLQGTDWAGWSAEAIRAAAEAKEAIDAVSFGSSPGGIKEIPLKLREAMAAFEAWREVGVDAAQAVRAAVDATAASDAGIEAATQAALRAQAENVASQGPTPAEVDGRLGSAIQAMAEAMKASQVNVQLSVSTINPDGLKQAVEQQILPAVIEAVDRNNRGSLTKLRQLLAR